MFWIGGDSLGPLALTPSVFFRAFYLLFIASLAGVLLDVLDLAESRKPGYSVSWSVGWLFLVSVVFNYVGFVSALVQLFVFFGLATHKTDTKVKLSAPRMA